MTQELGRIERPSAELFQEKRKLLLVPCLYQPPDNAEEGLAIQDRYWSQVRSQISSLEMKLGPILHVYHENLLDGGDEGIQKLEVLDPEGSALVRVICSAGANIEMIEDEELLNETLDLQRCLMMPFMSQKVGTSLQEWFLDTLHKRYDHISSRIDETLKEGQAGLLLINERHQVQFPSDIEVFFVAPPALDEFHRWMENWITQQRAAQA